MTVQSLCQQMTQKELCHWMAYYKIKGDEGKEESKDSSAQEPVTEQAKNDGDLLTQLLTLAGRKT